MTDDEIACGGPSPASMRGGALVGAFDHRERSREADVFMSEWGRANTVVAERFMSTQLSQNPGAKRESEWRGRPTGNGCIHEYLDLNMNRGGPFYHEYEWRRARPIMNTNSKRFAIFNSTHM